MRKQAAMVFIPVRSVTVADPPKISIDETMIFVASLEIHEAITFKRGLFDTYPKNIKTPCASVPHLAPTISSQVWA